MRIKIKKTGHFLKSKKYLKLINEAKVYDVAIKTPIIFDGRNQYDESLLKELGILYHQIGKKLND